MYYLQPQNHVTLSSFLLFVCLIFSFGDSFFFFFFFPFENPYIPHIFTTKHKFAPQQTSAACSWDSTSVILPLRSWSILTLFCCFCLSVCLFLHRHIYIYSFSTTFVIKNHYVATVILKICHPAAHIFTVWGNSMVFSILLPSPNPQTGWRLLQVTEMEN